jgi:hypothetical protein
VQIIEANGESYRLRESKRNVSGARLRERYVGVGSRVDVCREAGHSTVTVPHLRPPLAALFEYHPH